MLNNYQNPPRKSRKAAAMAAAQSARAAAAEVPEPITETDLIACIDEYNRTETAVHELRRVIFTALAARHGYRMLRVGPDSFNGSPAALDSTAYSDPPRLIKVESLGSEV